MGAAGLLLYADELQRGYLASNPNTAELMRMGHLRWGACKERVGVGHRGELWDARRDIFETNGNGCMQA